MRLSFLRIVAAVFVIVVLVPSKANAIIRTIDFTATDLTIVLGDPFGLLGLSTAPLSITGSFSFDTNATPFLGPTTSVTPIGFERTIASRPYISFFANIGGVIVNGAPSIVDEDQIRVLDAIGPDVSDGFNITSSTNQTLPTYEVDLLFLAAESFFIQDILFDTEVPTLTQINGLVDFGRFIIAFKDVTTGAPSRAQSLTVTFSENLSPVPVPAALPLFGTGLAFMGFVGWRRKRKAAAMA